MEQQSTVLTPKYIILKIVELKNALLKNWLAFIIIVAGCAAIGFSADNKQKTRTRYVAEIVFSMEQSGSSPDLGGLGSLLGMSQGGGEASLFSGENFLYMTKTRSTIERALLTPVTLNGKTDFFANFYIDSSFVKQDDWSADYQIEKWHKVRFTQPKRSQMTNIERLVLDHLYGRIQKEAIISRPDPRLSFLKIATTCENPTLSTLWAEHLLDVIEEIYGRSQNKKSHKMLAIMQRRLDSLGRAMGSADSRLARLTDINSEAVMIQGRIEQTKLSRNSGITSGLYMETSRNVENLKMSMIKEASLFTIVEPVHEPLEPIYFKYEYTKLGAFIGIFLSILFIIIRGVYRDALKDVKLVDNKS